MRAMVLTALAYLNPPLSSDESNLLDHFAALFWQFAPRPIGSVDIGINNLVFKIQPDAFIVAAVVASAWHRPVLSHRAAAGAAFNVRAVAVLILSNEVGQAQLPLNEPLVDILLGQSEPEAAAGRMAE